MYIYIYTHIHTYTMEYYSVIKKNEVLAFSGTWMGIEIFILNEVNQKDKYIICMWNLNSYTNQSIYKTKTVSWTQRTDLWLLNGKGEEE